jgi:uncharacterized phage protein gp47/JayE
MSFQPRSFVEILTDMIAFVQTRTNVSDFNVGSVIRTILEASALEDDEQYFQMVQLLDLFSINTATGEDLDRRLADFNLIREPAQTATGKVQFTEGNLISDQVALDAVSGGTAVKIFDSSVGFPLTFPYDIRIAEGTTYTQDYTVTALNTATNTFTISTPLTSDIFVGDRVSLVDGASAHTINTGTNIQAPPTVAETAKVYTTQEPAFIAAGNFFSNEVIAKASNAGSSGNTAANRVTQFVGSPPFSGAGVTNTGSMGGGRARESDQDFLTRALTKLQSLARGTSIALKSFAIGVVDPVTSQRVVSANLREDFVADEVIVYVDDGTGLEPDFQALAQTTLTVATAAPNTVITVTSTTSFPTSGFVLIGSVLREYQSLPSSTTIRLVGTVGSVVAIGAIVRFVDVFTESAESGQRRFRAQNFPIIRNTDKIFVNGVELTRDVDYEINRGTGEILIVDLSGVGSGDNVCAHYNYYTNLIAQVQKVLEGDEDDATNFPGVKAAGIRLSVEAPAIKRITVRATITAESSFTEESLIPNVTKEIENYISSLRIGDDVIRSKIIDVAHNTIGVRSVTVVAPTSDIVVLENELPVPFDSDEQSLVTVS